MSLTPLDIENAAFRISMRGYDRNDVELFRTAVLQAVTEYNSQIAQLRSRVTELENQMRSYRDSEELLKNSVLLAQKTSDDLAHAARSQADAIVGQARLEAEKIRASLADLQAQRERFEYEFYGLLAGFMARLEQGSPHLSPAARQPAARPAAPHAAPLLAELSPVLPLSSPPAAAPVADTRAPRPPQPAPPAEAQQNQRDLDIDDFSAALSQARPSAALDAEPAALPWESVEPDVDEAEADPYDSADDQDWAEDDLALEPELEEEADWDSEEDAEVYADEALGGDEELFEEAEDEDPDADAQLSAAGPGLPQYDDEPLGAVELPAAAAPADTDDTAAPAGSGLSVHPVDDDEDDGDEGPRVRRTSRWS
ncbi:DivIVA domain-containing protein [bacterium]|nr:DivIVA domain-containing protein [bacterium]